MQIVFFTHYFPPEGNAPASRTYEHCVRWAKAGHDVCVITGVPNVPNGVVYEGFRNRFWPQTETVEGIRVIRVWTFVAANAGGAKRILNYVSYMVSAVFAFLLFCRRPKVIVATSPQFFCGWAGLISSYLKWTKFVLEIRDIWPESIVTVGAMKKGWLVRVLERMERVMYRRANHIVAVGEGYKQNILSKADVADRISVVTNGVDSDQFKPRESSAKFREKYGLGDRFVCAYVGTIGMAHGLEVVLDAATRLRHCSAEMAFCLVGDGASREALEADCRQRGLQDMVVFTGRLPKQDMATVLASADAILVHLKKCDLFQTVIPSKIFEAMAMERPIIMGVAGESADIVARSGAGIQMEPGNVDDLVDAVERLSSDDELRNRLAKSGRPFVERHYSRDVLAAKMMTILETVAAGQKVDASFGQSAVVAEPQSCTAKPVNRQGGALAQSHSSAADEPDPK